jgi:hypothetical protein
MNNFRKQKLAPDPPNCRKRRRQIPKSQKSNITNQDLKFFKTSLIFLEL